MRLLFWTLAVLAAPLVVLAQDVQSETPAPITTDTPAYCAELARQMAAIPDPPSMARQLSEQGERMCQKGEVRGGLARLRRALLVSRDQEVGP
jgi:hypothetical protein